MWWNCEGLQCVVGVLFGGKHASLKELVFFGDEGTSHRIFVVSRTAGLVCLILDIFGEVVDR